MQKNHFLRDLTRSICIISYSFF